MTFELDGLPVRVIESGRKTVSLELTPAEIIMRVPRGMSQRQARDFVQRKSAWIEKNLSRISVQQEKLRELPRLTSDELRALSEKARRSIPEKVSRYAKLIGVSYGKISIRSQRTRWGSCSSKGDLSFNCLLMLAPDEVIDSVVVHELCHRKHMDHSKGFYDEVERVFPEYRRCRSWLKENGALLLGRLPEKESTK